MALSIRISLILSLALVAVYFLAGSFFAYQLSLYLIYAIVGMGVGFLWSKTGILSLGQAFFFGLGAYSTAFILKTADFALLQLAGIMIAIFIIGLLGYGIAYLVFKGRTVTGPFFSLITLALAMLAEQVFTSSATITGGFNGLSGYSTIFDLDPFGNFYWVVAIAVVLICFLFLWLDERPLGLLLSATGDNELRLQLLGFKTHALKAIGFAISAAIAGFAGALFANYQGIVTPSSIGFMLSAEIVIWVAVGGRFHVLGVILGTVVIGMLSANLRDQFDSWDIILALVFVAIVIKAPRGLWGLVEKIIPSAWLRAKVKTRASQPHELRAQPEPSALEFDKLHLSIGDVRILNNVQFASPKNGIVSIIGPNGAGKTSLLNVTTGQLKATSGAILCNDHPIHNRPPYMALASGIGRKLQVPSVFNSLSIDENVAIASIAGRSQVKDYFNSAALSWKSDWLTRLESHPSFAFLQNGSATAGSLPQGHRQFLEFLMTSVSEPKIMLLDEPGAGLTPDETQAMIDLIKRYRAEFNALVLVIEHDMQVVEEISDQVVVLNQGAVLASGSYDEVRNDPAVLSVYTGESKK